MTWAAIVQRVEPSVAAALGQRLRSMDYRPGQVIFAEGEPGDRLYAITAGKVKIARRSPDGRQNLQTVLGPSDIFGELSVVEPGPRTSNATALTDVRVMSMDRSELRALMADHPEITDQLLRMLARRLRRVIETQTDLVFTDVSGRLAKQLLQLAQQFGSRQDGAIRVVHDLTHEEIAQLVGASLVRVEKALTDFSRRGWDPAGRQQRADPGLRMANPASATKAVGALTAPANHPTLAPRRAKDLVSVSAASVDPQIQIRGSHFGPNGDLAGDVWRT